MNKTNFVVDFPFIGLHGIVLCGGKSSRMGSDKSLLRYHGDHTQRTWLRKMLDDCCEHVFLSVNTVQSTLEPFANLVDHPSCMGIGPMAGLISFYRRFGPQEVLLMGCDYPLLTQADIRNFINYSSRFENSCAFFDEAAGYYEPTLAWYKKKDAEKIEAQFRDGNYGLQFLLHAVDAVKFIPEHTAITESVDTPEQYIMAKEKLNTHATQHQ